jgi:hypothetical protein
MDDRRPGAMSERDPCSEELSDVVRAFSQRGTVEPGLDVTEDALIQLRKACRILDGIGALRDIDRHYTLVVEGSFPAIERSVQFYAVDAGAVESNEIRDHNETFGLGAEAGLFTANTADELIGLWETYRNGLYYQQRRATAEQADAMLTYARCLHEHATALAGRRHDCIC